MTDHPRFKPVKGDPDALHRHYHGGRVVDLAFTLVELWRTGRKDLARNLALGWRGRTRRSPVLRTDDLRRSW